MTRFIRFTLAALFLFSASPQTRAEIDTRERLSGSRRSQAEIRGAIRQLVERIDLILFEFSRNNIEGEEVRELIQTRKLLTETSLEQMEEILKYLDTAVQGRDQDQEQALLAAFEGQKNVLHLMRNLMSEYNRKRDVAAIPLLLEELITRQEMNLRATRQIADGMHPTRGVSKHQEPLVNSQFEEQRDINQEFEHVVSSMELLAFSEDKIIAKKYRESLEQVQNLRIREHLTGSLDALNQYQVKSAAAFETRAVDSLKLFSSALGEGNRARDPADASGESPDLMRELESILEEQIKVRESMVKRLENEKDLNAQARMQGEVIVRFHGMRDSLLGTMPEHRARYETLLETMRLARREMQGAKEQRPQSLQTVDKVIGLLKQFLEVTESTLAETENKQGELDAESFRERLELVIQEQELLGKETRDLEKSGGSLRGAGAQQKRLIDMTGYLYKEAGVSFPNLSPSLFKALEGMRESLNSLPVEGREGLALMAQEQALLHLREALSLLQNLTEAGDAETPPPSTEDLAEKVQEAQESVTRAEEAIAGGDLDRASQELSEAAEALDEAEDIAGELGENVPESTREDIADARAAMEEAIEAIEEATEPPAVAGEGESDPPEVEPAGGEQPAGGEEMAGGEEPAGGEQPAGGEEMAGGEEPAGGEQPAGGEEMAGAPGESAPGAPGAPGEAAAAAAEALEAAMADVKAALSSLAASTAAGTESALMSQIEDQLAQGQPAQSQGESAVSGPPGPPSSLPGTSTGEPVESAGIDQDGEVDSRGGAGTAASGELGENSPFTRLPPREREVIRQSLSEAHPPAYRDYIEQYRRNLAEAVK